MYANWFVLIICYVLELFPTQMLQINLFKGCMGIAMKWWLIQRKKSDLLCHIILPNKIQDKTQWFSPQSSRHLPKELRKMYISAWLENDLIVCDFLFDLICLDFYIEVHFDIFYILRTLFTVCYLKHVCDNDIGWSQVFWNVMHGVLC